MPVMAQGARPPAMVASIRSTTAGASIISPPPPNRPARPRREPAAPPPASPPVRPSLATHPSHHRRGQTPAHPPRPWVATCDGGRRAKRLLHRWRHREPPPK